MLVSGEGGNGTNDASIRGLSRADAKAVTVGTSMSALSRLFWLVTVSEGSSAGGTLTSTGQGSVMVSFGVGVTVCSIDTGGDRVIVVEVRSLVSEQEAMGPRGGKLDPIGFMLNGAMGCKTSLG